MGIEVQQTEMCDWESLQVSIYLGEVLEPEIETELKSLLSSWNVLGQYGAYGGFLNGQSPIWVEGGTAGFTVDMDEQVRKQ